MKKPAIISLALCVAGLLPAAAQQRDSLDFEFAVRQIEENYAGYPSQVTDANRADYRSLRERLRGEVRRGRPGYEAAGELFGWFGDRHLRAGDYSEPYLRPRADYSAMEYAPQRTACRVDAQTYLIRVPSFAFDESEMDWTAQAVESYRASGCENLIVDIRGNGGGRDQAYRPLLRLLYDRPGAVDNVEIRVSEAHTAFLREAVAGAGGDLDWLLPVLDSMQTGRAAFVPFPGDGELRFDTVTPLPRRVAILVDGNVASSAEQFVLDSRACSSRTVVYGRDNTLGCLDFSNIRRADLPGSKVTCWVPMTRSLRVAAGRGIDAEGIAPDVRIPLPLPARLADNVDEWVVWVAAQLKTRSHETRAASDPASAGGRLPVTAEDAVRSDFDFAVAVVERAYAGFPDKTADREAEYAALKARLQRQIASGRDGADAVAEYLGWFDDSHLICPGVEAYRPKSQRRATDYAARMERYAPRMTHCRIDGTTYLIRIPSFDPEEVSPKQVQAAVDAYLASGCEALVVDIRGNRGGNDSTYEPLLRLLYDRPGELDNMEYRVSALSIAHLKEFSDGSDNSRAKIALMECTPAGTFLGSGRATYRIRYDSLSPLPRRAALIVDGNVASSAEELVLETRACSRRTTIFGQDNTLGCLDYSNCEIVRFPQDSSRWMSVPVTRSLRVAAGRGIDAEGITPDVRIPLPLPARLADNVDEWVAWVAEKLKTETNE